MTVSQKIFRRQLARLIAVPLLLMIVVAGALEFQVRRLTNAMERVDHTDIVISSSRRILRLVVDEETGLRGYLLTRDQRFLQPYSEAETALPPLLGQLRDTVSDNPQQLQHLSEVQSNYEEWRRYSQDAMRRLNANDGSAAWLAFNLTGKELMDRLRGLMQNFVNEEESLRAMRVQRSAQANHILNWTLLGLALGLGAHSIMRLGKTLRW